MAKMKLNSMANVIISYYESQFIHYFPSKQGLAINLSWPVLKSKQRTRIELFLLIILLAFEASIIFSDRQFYLAVLKEYIITLKHNGKA